MRKPFLLSIVFLLYACPEPFNYYRYDLGRFQESVVNFEEVNSPYDDFNSTSPVIYNRHLFHFSSNRKITGNDFDVIGDNMFINWDKSHGSLEIGMDHNDSRFNYLKPMFDSLNTACNELGPYSIGFFEDRNLPDLLLTNMVMYSNDCSGDFDIKLISTEVYDYPNVDSCKINEVVSLDFLNTKANDMYPSFFGEDYYSTIEMEFNQLDNIEKIIHCSDNEGIFNIYETSIHAGSDIISRLLTSNDMLPEPEKLLKVNSAYDDKCPFVNGNLLVFASNRPGGFGGFDLYYSEYIHGSWSEPQNFGEKINTAFNEYRPIVIFHHQYLNNLMIFSSNRTEGKGGYDLYHVGIKQMVK